jgi:glycosyltransferase involved in cell wall biosynthesis
MKNVKIKENNYKKANRSNLKPQDNKKIIDVVVCTLNDEKTIEECLDAIEQDIPINYLIIVDGGSSDKTKEIIHNHHLAKKVKFYERPDLNLGESRAFAFTKVTTDFFALIDSDIVIHKGWFKEMVKSIKKDVGVVESGRTTHYTIPSKYGEEIDRGLFGQNIIRTKAVESISIEDLNVLCNEDNLTRYYIQREGYSWVKNGLLLAEHYTNPERYKDVPLLLYRLGVSKKILKSSGKADRLAKRYNKTVFMFLDIWYKPLKLWIELARKCFWYYVGWLRK